MSKNNKSEKRFSGTGTEQRFVISHLQKTKQGYTRYPSKCFTKIRHLYSLFCDVDGRKCKDRVKITGDEMCRSPYLKKGKCRKIKITMTEKIHVTVKEI